MRSKAVRESGNRDSESCFFFPIAVSCDRLPGTCTPCARIWKKFSSQKSRFGTGSMTSRWRFNGIMRRRTLRWWRLPMQLRLDYIGVSSYHGETRSTGELILTKALKLDVRDRDVLVVDDILDTGLTLVNIRAMLQKLQPRSVKFCTFLEKDIPHRENFQADYVGFRIPNKFVVGYGLDYRERYRNLPYVGTLRPEAIAAKL